jgi:regulator of sigma E protease
MDNSNKDACEVTDNNEKIDSSSAGSEDVSIHNKTERNSKDLRASVNLEPDQGCGCKNLADSGHHADCEHHKSHGDSEEKDSNFWNIFFVILALVLIFTGKIGIAMMVVVMIGIIATVHEFGHYLMAKLVGVRVDEFAVGMGSTKLWAKTIGETEYSIRPIPLGAFVKPAGMDPEEEFEPGNDPGERSFNRKSLPAKLLILFGGPVSNMILTIVLMTGIFFFVGDRTSTIMVDKVIKDKPAAVAGIRSGDIILSINGGEIKSYMDGISTIGEYPNKSIELEISRLYDIDGSEETVYKTITVSVIPEANDDGIGKIGIMAKIHYSQDKYIPLPFGTALQMGLRQTAVYGYKTYEAALNMFKKAFTQFDMPEQIGGPVKIATTISDAMQGGFDLVTFISFVSWLSLSIGVFNLIPIPALDGGRILLLLAGFFMNSLYKVLGKEIPEDGVISPKIEEFIHIAGFVFLMILFVAITYKDIKDVVRPPTQLERLHLKAADLITNKPAPDSVDDKTSLPDSSGGTVIDPASNPNSIEDHLTDPGRALSDAPDPNDPRWGEKAATIAEDE